MSMWTRFRYSNCVLALSLSVWVTLLPLRLYLCLYLCLSAYAFVYASVEDGVDGDRTTTVPSGGSAPCWVSVGDLHGDLKRAREVLALAGLTDEDGNWKQKKNDCLSSPSSSFSLVQTGDLVDRGHDSVGVLELFDQVRDQAAEVGDEVVLLLGNHELMNLNQDFRYVSERELQRLGTNALGAEAEQQGKPVKVNSREAKQRGLEVWRDLFSVEDKKDKGTWGNKLVEERRIAAIRGTGGCKTLFVHAGVTPSHLSTMANLIKKALDGKYKQQEQEQEQVEVNTGKENESSSSSLSSCEEESESEEIALLNDLFFESNANANANAKGEGELDSKKLVQVRGMLQGTLGPVWYRPYAQASEDEICSLVRDVLLETGARHMVIGHTPQHKITTRCEGALVMVDVGMSRAYGGQVAALECNNEGSFYAIYKHGKELLFKDNMNNHQEKEEDEEKEEEKPDRDEL